MNVADFGQIIVSMFNGRGISTNGRSRIRIPVPASDDQCHQFQSHRQNHMNPTTQVIHSAHHPLFAYPLSTHPPSAHPLSAHPLSAHPLSAHPLSTNGDRLDSSTIMSSISHIQFINLMAQKESTVVKSSSHLIIHQFFFHFIFKCRSLISMRKKNFQFFRKLWGNWKKQKK